MNRISLTLKSRTLEKEYHSQQITANHRKLQIILITYLAIGIMNLINLSVDYLNREGKDGDDFIGSRNYKISLGFLIAWMASVVMNLVLHRLMPHKINIYYTIQHLINVAYHLILIKFQINVTEGSLPSQSSNTTQNPRTQFHVQEGFFLAIIIFRGMMGTKFLLKVLIAAGAIISLLVISYSQQEKPYIQIPFGLVCLFLYCYQMYQHDRTKRQDFLMRRKDEEWNKIIKNVLPTNLIIAKYNAREARIELELANRKANKELNITDSDSFQTFAHETLVQKNEIIQNEKDLHRILKSNKNANGISNLYQADSKLNASIQVSANGSNNNGINSNNNLVGNLKKETTNTLYQLIRSRIDEEMKNRTKTNGLGVVIDSEQDNNTTEHLQSKQLQRRRQSLSANPQATSSKKVSEYIGTHIQNGFDVDKKLLIRVSTFSLSEVFAVITIENETYREKFVKQIKFSTFLEKIFSFQLRKFKESYQVVLNELNRISNIEVQNQLLYHNVKCMNRVNSYLQYFEFKNALKHEFAVTQFSLSGEIFKILNSLRHYIAGKRVRTFYENTSNITTISTDEERLQQIFFMIFEHLLVNAPPDGYIAIRIVNDKSIANCFKVQIQSTYDSQLLNSISLYTFNIDELYNDYEIYQNYFVSLRIAIKLITLMGPYSKIDFSRSEDNILFTSFSIFSDLEVIKQQEIRPQTNHHNQSMARSQTNIPSHLMESPLNNYPGSFYQSEQASFMKQSGGKRIKKQTSFKRINLQNVSEFYAFSQNIIQNENESANLSEAYDEEHSFNQWFKLKLMQHSTVSNQKILPMKSTNNNSFNINSNTCLPLKVTTDNTDSLPCFVPQFAPSVQKPVESQAQQSEATFPSEQVDVAHSSLISLPNQPDTLTFEGESIFPVQNFSPVCDGISTQLTSKQAIFNEGIYKKKLHSSHSLVLSNNQKESKDKDYSQTHKISRQYNKQNSQLLHQTLPQTQKQFKNMSDLKNQQTKKPNDIDRHSLHFASCNNIPSNQEVQKLLQTNVNNQVAEFQK